MFHHSYSSTFISIVRQILLYKINETIVSTLVPALYHLIALFHNFVVIFPRREGRERARREGRKRVTLLLKIVKYERGLREGKG